MFPGNLHTTPQQRGRGDVMMVKHLAIRRPQNSTINFTNPNLLIELSFI